MNISTKSFQVLPASLCGKTSPPGGFEIIDGHTLMAQEYEPLQFAVEKILPHGAFILAGSGKIGKSWLLLDLCVNVATGGKLWDFSSEQGDVLYLALEDNYPRLQDRLNKIKAAVMLSCHHKDIIHFLRGVLFYG
jgi:RecA-family ATPase